MDIKIDIDDERYFTDVAPIVDRENFAEEIKRLRSALDKIIPKNYFSQNLYDEKIQKKIDAEVEASRKRLFLPVVFRSVISAVAFRDEVTNSDYSPAYLVHETRNFYDKRGEPSADETYAIILSPSARDNDVLKALQEYRDMLNKNPNGGHFNYNLTPRVWGSNIKKPSIWNYRKWWLLASKENKTPEEIADMETKNCPIKTEHDIGKNKPKGCTCFHVSTITKGIETYESLRSKTPTL